MRPSPLSFLLIAILGIGLASSASAQLPSWAEPVDRPVGGAYASEVPDDFPYGGEGPQQVPMGGLLALALAGGAYGAYRLRATN